MEFLRASRPEVAGGVKKPSCEDRERAGKCAGLNSAVPVATVPAAVPATAITAAPAVAAEVVREGGFRRFLEG